MVNKFITALNVYKRCIFPHYSQNTHRLLSYTVLTDLPITQWRHNLFSVRKKKAF